MLLSCRVNTCSLKTFFKLQKQLPVCSWKFCKFHRKTPVLGSLFSKVWGPATLFKRYSNTDDFPVKFAIFYRTPILKNICERQLLNFKNKIYVKFNFYNLSSIICLFPIGWTLFFSLPDNSCYKFKFLMTSFAYIFPYPFTLLYLLPTA